MKIAFIYPHMAEIKAVDAMQPLCFGLLASRTPPTAEVALFDERVEAVDYDMDADLVALSVQTFTAKRSYNIADRFRDRGVSVVLGGCHPTLLPDEAGAHADSLVIGDGEFVWPQVVEDCSRGVMKEIYRADTSTPLRDLIPDREIFNGKRYSRLIPVQFGRGCRFSCDFCSVHALYGDALRQREVDEVSMEIEGIGEKPIVFVDDNLFVNTKEVDRLLSAIGLLRRKWVCQASLDLAWNNELLRSMAKSGCKAVFVGFESMEVKNLRQMNKTGNLHVERYAEAVERFKDHGIMVAGSFLFGYDFDTRDTIKRALDFALEQKLCLSHFNPLFPTPRTPLFDRLSKQGRLRFDTWWLSDDYRYGDALFDPIGMSAEELTTGCLSARVAFNKYSSHIKRAFDCKANCGSPSSFAMYFAANFISRKEIYRKQGVALG